MPLFIRPKKLSPLKPKANPYPSRFQQWHHSLGVTFVFLLVIGGAVRLYKPFYDAFQQKLFEVTGWIQGAFIKPFYETRSLLKDTHLFMHLKEEYAYLKEENERLKWQLHVLAPLQNENAVLRQMLNMPLVEKYEHLTTRVLSSPYDGLHHFFLIATGQEKGLKKDQAVVAHEGVVGRLDKIGKTISRVLLLNDGSSRIPVMTVTSEQKAILAGDGSFFPALVYVGDVRKVQIGEKIVTSGLGGIFPVGFPVGIVNEITNGKIRVKPFVSLQNLEWVHILQNNVEGFIEEFNRGREGE